MNQLRRTLLKAPLPLLAILLLTLSAQATTVVMLSDKELVVDSRFIITGKVRSVISAWDDDHSTAWTYVEVRADRVLKGALPSKTIVLKQPGGAVGASGVHVFGMPNFLPGQDVLLYLNSGPDGSLHVAHAFIGMFTIIEDGAGRSAVKRVIDAAEIELLSRNDAESVTNRAPLDEYVGKIESTVKSEAVRIAQLEAERADQPALAEPVEYRRKKKEASGFSAQFAFMGNGVRWMQADAGQAIVYQINPTSAPTGGGGSSEISRAMDAWAAQSGANIRLQLGGQTSSCGIQQDGVNSISFGDCKGQLDPPAGCSGVVAQTSISYTYESRVVNGTSFNRLVEADLVFNKGMDCFLGTSANLAEVACHELGHSIGLAHSGDASAIMWATAHGRGRDATLGADDKSGVLAVYPSTGGTGGGGGGGGTGGGGGGTGGGGGGGGTGGGGGGGGTGGSVSITTVNLPDGVVGHSYKQTLVATGGATPYRWSMVGGDLPPGLKFSTSGVVEGTPTKAGNYSLGVQVYDASGNSNNVDGKRVSINIVSGNGVPSAAPAVTRVKVKGSKKLTVYGVNFNQNSVIVLNGLVIQPRSFEQDGSEGQLFYKGKLNLGGQGSNVVVVITGANNSVPFIF